MPSKPSARSEARNLLAGLYERGEEVVGVFLDELAHNPRVREQLERTFDKAVDAKRNVDKSMQTILSLLNVPSRADYSRLVAKVEALQGSLVNLNMKLDRLLAAQHQVPRHAAPPDTGHRDDGPRRPPRPRRAKTSSPSGRG